MTDRRNGMGFDDVEVCKACGALIWRENGQSKCGCETRPKRIPPVDPLFDEEQE